MATYSPESLKITAATTGGKFQQGAWYSGRQFWNGTLSDPGTIHPESNQQGAGKAVSAEVIAQTSPGNVAYINKERANVGLAPAPQTTQQVTSLLNDYQSGLFEGSGPETRGVQTASEIAADLKSGGLLPGGAPPTPPSLVEQYGALRQTAGVDAIQGSITDLKGQQDAIASQLQVTKTAEKGKPVAQNVIEGRVSQEQQTAQDQYDFIGRQLGRKQEELNSALTNIQMIMQFSQTDYQNASTAYNTQFDHAISTINLIRGIQNDQKTDIQRAQDNARANAQIMVNAIKDGNLDINSLDPASQAQLNKLEVQAGLPIGLFQSLRMDPKANVLFTSSNNGITQVGIRNPDGSVSVQSYGTATGGGSDAKVGSPEYQATARSNIVQGMAQAANSYGNVSPQVWAAGLQAWISDTGKDRRSFIDAFRDYADTNRGDFDKVYFDREKY